MAYNKTVTTTAEILKASILCSFADEVAYEGVLGVFIKHTAALEYIVAYGCHGATTLVPQGLEPWKPARTQRYTGQILAAALRTGLYHV